MSGPKWSTGPMVGTIPWLFFTNLLLLCPSVGADGQGDHKVIGSSQPISAQKGDDVILPCLLEPLFDVTQMTVEWLKVKSDGEKKEVVHIHRDGYVLHGQNQQFINRTSLFKEEMKNGNISLKLCNVTLTDAGKYRCHVPKLESEEKMGFVHLVVESTTVMGDKGDGVEVFCESRGWPHVPYPVTWLDNEGNILSAGATVKVKDQDGLYNLTRHVVVKKTVNNRFTCRVVEQTDPSNTVPGEKDIPAMGILSIVICITAGYVFIAVVVCFTMKLSTGERRRQDDKNEEEEPIEAEEV